MMYSEGRLGRHVSLYRLYLLDAAQIRVKYMHLHVVSCTSYEFDCPALRETFHAFASNDFA
jgi:hypothetical protein